VVLDEHQQGCRGQASGLAKELHARPSKGRIKESRISPPWEGIRATQTLDDLKDRELGSSGDRGRSDQEVFQDLVRASPTAMIAPTPRHFRDTALPASPTGPKLHRPALHESCPVMLGK